MLCCKVNKQKERAIEEIKREAQRIIETELPSNESLERLRENLDSLCNMTGDVHVAYKPENEELIIRG